jgi:hypothetical protein
MHSPKKLGVTRQELRGVGKPNLLKKADTVLGGTVATIDPTRLRLKNGAVYGHAPRRNESIGWKLGHSFLQRLKWTMGLGQARCLGSSRRSFDRVVLTLVTIAPHITSPLTLGSIWVPL